jgi:hypothetical protein
MHPLLFDQKIGNAKQNGIDGSVQSVLSAWGATGANETIRTECVMHHQRHEAYRYTGLELAQLAALYSVARLARDAWRRCVKRALRSEVAVQSGASGSRATSQDHEALTSNTFFQKMIILNAKKLKTNRTTSCMHKLALERTTQYKYL